jgi:plastocyanin
MSRLRRINRCCLLLVVGVAVGCSPKASKTPAPGNHPQEAVIPAFHVDPSTAGSISGTIRYIGPRPAPKKIDMSNEPACVEAHKGRAVDESLVVASNGMMANAFIYVKAGLEGKRFETPSTPVQIDQNGCWFKPRVLGIQTGQILEVTNSDPVTHNIHPMAEVNREWNHSQGAGDPPIARKFAKPEIMIPVKCNIHSWMHAWIGVLDNPYFAVSKPDGTYSIQDLPPGTYTIGVWQETLGTQERQVTVAPHSNQLANFTFKGK